jgi:hypothetical protein
MPAPGRTHDETSFEGHLAALAERLERKDPRRINTRAEGWVVLVLKDEAGTVHRGRIHLERTRTIVEAQGGMPAEARHAIIRGRLSDWVSFASGARENGLSALEIFGEPEVVIALYERLQQARDPIALRASIQR